MRLTKKRLRSYFLEHFQQAKFLTHWKSIETFKSERSAAFFAMTACRFLGFDELSVTVSMQENKEWAIWLPDDVVAATPAK